MHKCNSNRKILYLNYSYSYSYLNVQKAIIKTCDKNGPSLTKTSNIIITEYMNKQVKIETVQ